MTLVYYVDIFSILKNRRFILDGPANSKYYSQTNYPVNDGAIFKADAYRLWLCTNHFHPGFESSTD